MKSYKSVTVGNGLPTSPMKTSAFITKTNQVLFKDTILASSNVLNKVTAPPSPFSPLPPAREERENENEENSSDVDALLDSEDEYALSLQVEGGLQPRKKKGRKAILPAHAGNGRPGQAMSSSKMLNAAQKQEQAQKQRAAKSKRRTTSRTIVDFRRAKNAQQLTCLASPGVASPLIIAAPALIPSALNRPPTPAPICALTPTPSVRVLQYYPVPMGRLSDADLKVCHEEQQPLPASPQIPVTSNKFDVLREAGSDFEEEVLISTVVEVITEDLPLPVSLPAKEQEQEDTLFDSDSDSDSDVQLEPVEEFASRFEDSVAFKATKAVKLQPSGLRAKVSAMQNGKAALNAGRRQLAAAKRAADKADWQNVRALRLCKQGLLQNGVGSPIRGGLRPWSGLQSPTYAPATGRSGISLPASAEAAAPFDAAFIPSFGIVEDDISAVLLNIEGSSLFTEGISSIFGIPLNENSFAVLAEDDEVVPPTPSPAAKQKRRREGVVKRGLRGVGAVVGRVISGAVAVVKTVGKAVKRVLSRRS